MGTGLMIAGLVALAWDGDAQDDGVVNLESHTRMTAQVSLGIRLGRGEE